MSLQFSVITPSFRQGRFIERTIQSVLSQNISDIEYVICDGGSEDETLEVLKRYDDRIRWISEPDRGQADAVNKGISMTSGEIVAWINSDDIYYQRAFETVKEAFEAYPDVEAIYGNAHWIDKQDMLLEPFPVEHWDYNRLKETCYLCQPAVFFKRSLVEKYGGLDASLNYCMDYELWLRYGQHTQFIYLPKLLAGSRMYKENKTLGQRLAAHYEINTMLIDKFGAVPTCWVLGYALVKVEETQNLSRTDPTQVRALTKALIWMSLRELYYWKRWIPPLVIIKMVFWWLYPDRSWFRRSVVNKC